MKNWVVNIGITILLIPNRCCRSFSLLRPLQNDPLHLQRRITVIKASSQLHEEEESHPSIIIDRRSALLTGASRLILPFLSPLSVSAAATQQGDYDDHRPRTILITGSNSGIGFNTALRMAQYPCKHTILLACRTLAKAQDAISRIQQQSSSSVGNLIPLECNLADLKSIQSCIDAITSQNINIDVLCLNAAIARNTSAQDVARTNQGFEATIGTNHIGHFYLSQGLLPLIQERIVLTASGVHDPASPGGAQGSPATLGNLKGMIEQGIDFEMVDGEKFDADKAYKDSKLCNVLFTRELQKRLDVQGSLVKVNCFNPGLIVSTGLFRDQNPIFTKLFDVAATNVFKVGETVEWGGAALEYMSFDKTVGKYGGLYYSSPPGSSKYGTDAFGREFVSTEVSMEARDDAKARKLWDLTEKLIQSTGIRS